MSAQLHSELSESAQTSSMQFEVTLPSDVSAISPVVDWVMRLGDELEYGDEKEFGIEMALREALANAVLHGCKSDPAKTVECLVKGDREEGILIVVRDPGAGFDLKSLSSPIESSKVAADHGRGIFLIHNLMDEVTHEQNGTIIRMRKF